MHQRVRLEGTSIIRSSLEYQILIDRTCLHGDAVP